MNPVLRLMLATSAGAGGLWLLVSGLLQRRPALHKMSSHLARQPVIVEPGTAPNWGRLGAPVAARLRSRPSIAADLRLAGRTADVHAVHLTAAALAALFGLPLVFAVAQAVGLASIGVPFPVLVAIVGAAGAPVAVHASMRANAAKERSDLRFQLSAYLDVVTMLLAGNVGNEGALRQAAQVGDGRLFVELRKRITIAETANRSLVAALAQLGEELDLVELQQISASASLAGSAGAPVARTLAAKCATLRSALSAEQEAEARVRTGKITVPLVGMSLLIMACVIYPALNFS